MQRNEPMFGSSIQFPNRKKESVKMTTNRARMFAGMAAAVLIGLPTAAFAADAKFTTHLEGTRNDPRAMGRAAWVSEGRSITLSVQLAHVSSTELATVYVNGRFVGVIDVSAGAGTLNLDNRKAEDNAIPIIKNGSTIEVYGDDDTPILVGMFRNG